MTTETQLRFIKYYELDERVNLGNYQDVSIKAEFDERVIESIFNNVEMQWDLPQKVFENVKTTPNYEQHLEYVSHLWIEKSFYFQIQELINTNGLSHEIGTVCLVLLILKHFDNIFKETPDYTIERKQKMEFAKFVDFLTDYRNKKYPANKIELIKGKAEASFDHADYILRKILFYIDSYYKDDLIGWLQLGWERGTEGTFINNKVDMENAKAMYRLYCLNAIKPLVINAKTKRPSKYFLCNQLLGCTGILNYSMLYKNENKTEYGKQRSAIISRIKQQFKYQCKITV